GFVCRLVRGRFLRGLVRRLRGRRAATPRRSTSGSAWAAPLPLRLLLRLGDRSAVLELLDARRDDLLPRLDARLHDVVSADELAERHWALLGDELPALSRLGDEDEGLAVQAVHGQRRDRHALVRRPDDARAHELLGAERDGRILDVGLDEDRLGLAVHE